MKDRNTWVWLLLVMLGCSSSSSTSDYSVIDNCTPGISPNAICSVSVRWAGLPLVHLGGLTWLDRNLEPAPDLSGYALVQSAQFTTDYTALLQFAEKTIGSAAKHDAEHAAALDFRGISDYWITSDGTWAMGRGSQGLQELRWYSPLYPRVPTPEYIKETAERAGLRPAPVSGPIWRALGRFIIDHPA